MAADTPDYYLYCESCDFCQHVEKVLHRTSLTSVDELVENVSRFHCSVCGAKKIIIKEKKDVSALDW
ncbi:MAG: hypothetical protein Q9M17_00610 [Mariprofundus sp.]|nr:hypothetical protein [Mariprofundus sp.]